MKFYVIAGEASGDLHGANLIRELKRQHPGSTFRAWGGDKMEAAGAQVVKHYRDLAFMGFIEVIANLRTILRNINECKKDIAQFKPDALILIDYPGFNMRIGPFAKQLGIKVLYYISPQIWAWKQNRVHKLKQFVDRMYVILPFEKDFYKRFDVDVDFVGHPLLDAIGQYNRELFDETTWRRQHGLPVSTPLVVMLPGSRKQEVRTMLNVMIGATRSFAGYTFVVAGAPSLEPEFYHEVLKGQDVQVIHGETYALLRIAHAALVTSGTATLETALFKVPQVVCYKGNQLSYLIARRLVKVNYISLVNLIMGREVVKELIQHEMNADTVSEQLRALCEDGQVRNEMREAYEVLREKLGGEGASELTAKLMLKTLNESGEGTAGAE
ncbi:MAG: lipid-A-disaccharide synthase [Cryomorphaceae bacterium]|nr:MAG: lipid-A-disaccharide synthase [Cryomorphaceae bacterium]